MADSYRSLLPWPAPRSERLFVVGHVTSTTARLWVRVSPSHASSNPVLHVIRTSSDVLPPPAATPADRVVRSAPLDLRAEHGFSQTVEIDGLSAGTRYRVGVLVEGGRDWVIGGPTRWTSTGSNSAGSSSRTVR